MASTPRIPPAEITGAYGAMVTRFSEKMLGDVPEPVKMARPRPAGLQPLAQPSDLPSA